MADEKRDAILNLLLMLIPYAGIAWTYMVLAGGKSNEFWLAFWLLIITRIIFEIIEFFVSVAAWRLYGRRSAINRFLRAFRDANMPNPKHDDDGLEYFTRISGDMSQPESVRDVAKCLYFHLITQEKNGIVLGARTHAAADAAVAEYRE